MVAPVLPPPPTPAPAGYGSYGQAQAHYPPLPSGTPPPPAYAPPGPDRGVHAGGTAKRGGTKAIVWVVAALAHAGAGVGIALAVMHGRGGGGGAGSGAAYVAGPGEEPEPGPGGEVDTWAGTATAPSQPSGVVPGGSIDPWASGGTPVETPGGSQLLVPSGMTRVAADLSQPGAFVESFTGSYQGVPVRLAIVEVVRTRKVDGLAAVQAILATTSQHSAGTRMISGRAFSTIISDASEDDGMYRYEHLLIHDPTRALLVSVGTPRDQFDDAEPLRGRIFLARFRY
jgi:hypothetical protein